MVKQISREKKIVVDELHRRALKNFVRRRTIIKGFDDLWQSDLAIMTNQKKENHGYTNILLVIDCFSKYLWTWPLKTKSAEEVTAAMEKILRKAHPRKPIHLQTDHGKEFYNSNFKNLMQKYKINHYSSFSTTKASIVERAVRSIKELLFKHFSLHGTFKWLDALPEITAFYNARKHRTINMAPKDVTKANEAKVLMNSYSFLKQVFPSKKFKVGDIVRVSKQKHLFAKGYTPNWSTELFKIRKVKLGNPSTFLLSDLKGADINGCFYAEEIQKTTQPDVYLIEKILKRKGSKYLVKWLGFDKEDSQSWINKSDLF